MSEEIKTQSPQQNSLDASSLMRKVLRYWWVFLLSFVVCMGLAALYMKIKSPTYLVLSTMMIGDNEDSSPASAASKAAGGSSIIKSLVGGGNSNVDNEVIVMGSQSLLCKTISELGINRTYIEKNGVFSRKTDHYKESPIEIDAPKELFDTLSTSLKFTVQINKEGKADINVKKGLFGTLVHLQDASLPVTVKTPYGLFSVRPTRFYKTRHEYDMIVGISGDLPKAESMREDLTVGVLSKKADAIYLSIEDKNIDRGKDILNTLMRLYNEKGLKDKDEQALNTGKFIDERLSLIYKDLMGSEAEIESYKKAHNIVDPEIQGKSIVGKQAYSENVAIALATQYRIVSMIKEFIANPANRNSLIPFDADSTAASGSIKAYNNLITERMRLEGSAKENNQVLQRLEEQIGVMHSTVTKSVNNTLRAIQIKINQANAQNAESTGKMADMPTQEREVLNLYRDQKIQNELYTFLLQKREENALRLAASTPKGKIVDAAYAETKPVKPKTSVILFVALLFSFIIPTLLLYVKKLLTTKFNTQDELEEISVSPVIGHIHHNRHKTAMVVAPGKTSPIVELFRYVRNNVQFMLPEDEDKVVLVTSSVSGEGKSFISANLAASFALLDKKVALVGMDIRSPQLAGILSVNEVPGVTSYLSKSDVTLEEIRQSSPEVENLDVFVGGAIPPNPSELLLNKRARQLFEELRSHYDIIIVDSAPVAMVSDTFSLSRHANATLYVTRAGYTKRNFIKYFNRLVENKQLKNVGVIINDTKPNQDNSYGYGYGKED